MTQGMFSAVTGIRTSQVRMDVIADNIANLNTVAFKNSMVNFQTVFSRTQTSGTAPVGTLGGTNPKQVGLGVTVGEMGRDFSQGNIQTTGRASDLNIQGEGFFVLENGGAAVGPQSGTLLTRAGNFQLDANGVMVNPNGLRVIGTDQVTSVSTDTSQYVQIPRNMNIVKTDTDGDGINDEATIDDSTLNGGTGNPLYNYSLTTYSVSTDGAIEATYSSGDRITVRTNAAGTGREVVFYPAEGGSGFTTGDTTLTISGTAGGDPIVQPHQLQIQFATVTNNAGLVSVGGNLFSTAVNSGNPFYSIGRTAGVGLCDAGGLETSNVDLTKEFSLMMLSQRALEANSRTFDAQNSVLQTIVNLAR
jgi:flagellar hook protein FlgE